MTGPAANPGRAAQAGSQGPAELARLSTVLPLEPPRIACDAPLLELSHARRRYGETLALDDVSLRVWPGEVLGIVGESGSGKSTLLRLLNLEESADGGRYVFSAPGAPQGDLFALARARRLALRDRLIGIVYQNPHLGLRMGCSSGGNVAERLLMAGERRFARLRQGAREALAASDFPLDRMDASPDTLSGGMQQRAQLAKAIALAPPLLLLDEPTTGLDVSVQALVLDTLRRLQRTLRVAMIVVSHDLGVIRMLAERVIVMRRGRVVEAGLTDQVLGDPQAPYTQQLVQAKL